MAPGLSLSAFCCFGAFVLYLSALTTVYPFCIVTDVCFQKYQIKFLSTSFSLLSMKHYKCVFHLAETPVLSSEMAATTAVDSDETDSGRLSYRCLIPGCEIIVRVQKQLSRRIQRNDTKVHSQLLPVGIGVFFKKNFSGKRL